MPHAHFTVEGGVKGPHGDFQYRQYVSLLKRQARVDVSKVGSKYDGLTIFVSGKEHTLLYNRTNGDGLNGLVCYKWNHEHWVVPKVKLSYVATEYRDSYLSNHYNAQSHSKLMESLAGVTGDNVNVTSVDFWLESGTLRPVAGEIHATMEKEGEKKSSWTTEYTVSDFEPSVPAYIYTIPKVVIPTCMPLNHTEIDEVFMNALKK